MKVIVLAAFGLALISSAAMAGSTCYYIGTQLHCNSTDGSSYTGYGSGNQDHYTGMITNPYTGQRQQFNQTCYYIGNIRHCD